MTDQLIPDPPCTYAGPAWNTQRSAMTDTRPGVEAYHCPQHNGWHVRIKTP